MKQQCQTTSYYEKLLCERLCNFPRRLAMCSCVKQNASSFVMSPLAVR